MRGEVKHFHGTTEDAHGIPVETNMAVPSLPAPWNRKGDPRLAAGLVAVPALLMTLQVVSRFCTKLS